MSRPKSNLHQKVIKINDQQQAMLDVFTEKWGFVSESEVFRQALLWFYRKTEPEYTKPSPLQEEKARRLAEERRTAAMSEEEYNDEFVGGHVTGAQPNGKRYVLLYAWGNMVRPVELDLLRTTLKQMPDLAEVHKAGLAERGDVWEFCRTNPEYVEALPDGERIVL